MKESIINKLFCDPNFDPVNWMGKAFELYIKTFPQDILEDEICCKYIIEAMEPNDASTIARHLPAKEEHIYSYIIKLSKLVSCYKRRIAFEYLMERIKFLVQNHHNHPSICSLMLHAKGMNTIPDLFIINNLSEDELIQAIITWDQAEWGYRDWMMILGKISNSKLNLIVHDPGFPGKIGKKENNEASGDDWIHEFQNLLYYFLMKLPPADLTNWMEILQKIDLSNIYKNTKGRTICKKTRRVQKKYPYDSFIEYYYVDPKIDESLCRCGEYSSTISGARNHSGNCTNRINLFTASKIRLAQLGILSLVCDRCGKTCNSKPGYTLHRKRCKDKIELEPSMYLN